MIRLGRIIRLQVQTASLKVGSGANQRYDLGGLQQVASLELSDGGVQGWQDSAALPDVHHRDHPQSKLRGTLNSISFGFTGHYTAMRAQFGAHLEDGLAAENILIEHDHLVTLADVRGGIAIVTADGNTIDLDDVLVAAPCAPFSRWSLRFPEGAKPDRRVTSALQFLGDGMRGYYCRYLGQPVRISADDEVFLRA